MYKVAIAMGSTSDLPIMEQAKKALQEFGVGSELLILSAHRTPEDLVEFAKAAHQQGYQAIIAGAGGAAHLPGMLASLTPLPVIGVPVNITALNGQDSLLSIVQMPKGVPVATVAIDGAWNAGLLAVQILATQDSELQKKILDYKKGLLEKVQGSRENL